MNDWVDAEQRVERAQQLCEARRFSEALTEMEAAVSINPNNALWHAQRGFLLQELDRDVEALAAYERSLELESDNRDVLMLLGVLLSGLGRFARAAEVLETVSKKHPGFEPAYCYRVFVYAQLEQHDRAEEVFYVAQQLDEDCPRCFFHMGLSLSARGQSERAIYCWRRVLAVDSEHPGVHHRIAQAYRSMGKPDDAQRHYLEEYRIDPGNTDLLFEMADLALGAGRTSEAVDRLKQIVELDPRHEDAQFALGKLWLQQGEAEKALSCFEAVSILDGHKTNRKQLSLRTGLALLHLGRFTQALPRLKTAADDQPDNGELQLWLGDCLLALEQTGEAAGCYRRALSLNADSARAHYSLGLCMLRSGSDRSALDHCLAAIRAKPDHLAALQTTALAHLRLGHWREAKRLLQRVLTQDADNALVKRLLGRFWRYRFRRYLRVLRSPIPFLSRRH
jgi:tetratricopeptide (TPR) repeat protein